MSQANALRQVTEGTDHRNGADGTPSTVLHVGCWLWAVSLGDVLITVQKKCLLKNCCDTEDCTWGNGKHRNKWQQEGCSVKITSH